MHMRSHTLLAGTFFMLAFASRATAQTKPDFSGRWTVAPPPQETGRGGGTPRADMGSGWGSTITLTQSTTALTLEWVIFTRGDLKPPLTFLYPLDGSEHTNAFMMGRGTEKQISRASWDGGKLVITTKQSFPNLVEGQTVETVVTRTLSLASPTTLVVETTRNGVLGGNASTTRTVYTKG